MKSLMLVLALSFIGIISHATEQADYFDQFLEDFSKDSYKTMNQIPPKFDSKGKRLPRNPRFHPSLIKNQEFIREKTKSRDQIIGMQIRPLAGIDVHGDVSKFFRRGFPIEKNLTNISKVWINGKLDSSPWSSYYWATYKGGIADRYADSSWPRSMDFLDYYQAYQKSRNINFDDQNTLDNLSPAEKYDILVGDSSFTMTKWSMEDAHQTYLANGKKIESWFGICHGWAPASFMMPRPEKTVEYRIESFQGKSFNLKFYPDDVKALASLLWANSAVETYYIGTRCEELTPKLDESGRVIESTCWDVNPSTWHLALVNQLNANKSSFVFDANYDSEVWNQPIVSYSYQFFNPETKKNAETIVDAQVRISDFASDKFKKFRSSRAVAVVGVKMKLTYGAESVASHAETDSEEADLTSTVNYVYDLELDAQGNLIGGEWYQNAHPDFLWVPAKNSRAMSAVDRYLQGSWSGNLSAPRSWTQIANMASSYGQPLGLIVEGLIERTKH